MGKEKRVGPSGRAAGLTELVNAAEADRLPPEELAATLARARTGDPEAVKRLDEALRYLIFQVGNDGTFGHRYGAYLKALEKLLGNSAQPVEFIKAALWRAEVKRRQEESGDIRADDSTNCRRRKKGQAEHKTIKQVPVPPVDPSKGIVDDILHDRGGREEVIPTMFELVEDLASDEFEADVMQLLSQGYSQLRIAATLSRTKYEVAEAVKRIRRRAEALGYDE